MCAYLDIVELDVESAGADGELGLEDVGESGAELAVDAGAEAPEGHDLPVRRGLLAPRERRRHRPVDRHRHVLRHKGSGSATQSESRRHSVEQTERAPGKGGGRTRALRILACR